MAQDPDTLFFERRRASDGGSETGLRLRTPLDAVALPQWREGHCTARIGLMHIISRACAHL